MSAIAVSGALIGVSGTQCRRSFVGWAKAPNAQRPRTRKNLDIISFLLYTSAMPWTFQVLNTLVDEEILALPADMQARLLRLGELIEQSGLQALPRDSVSHLEGKLWERRISGRDGIARAIYVTATGQRVVVVRVFVKKKQKTPPRELEMARQRAKEIT